MQSPTRLIIAANRLPVRLSLDGDSPTLEPSTGGLATGLRSVRREDGRDVWIGWPGRLGALDEKQRQRIMAELQRMNAIPVALSDDDTAAFYDEISNAVLWPICHDRIDRLPLHVEGWDVYESVNERYADCVAEHWHDGDTIWVHDYQLLRLPALLRRRLPTARIGFFLHVPFPNPEVFFTLPVRRSLVEGMLGADLIGFHTRRYRGHFTAALRRLFNLEMDPKTETVTYCGRRIRLGVFPMGIDAANFADRAITRAVTAKALEFRQPGKRLFVGIDRLDYSKGIERRLLALRQLLVTHPEWRGRIRLVQVAVPTRDGVTAYRKLRKDVESLVGRINGELATPSWTPITYIHRAIPPVTLMALYLAADAMIVTPLRDGMNLVAKEFLASRVDEDGVLVLSEFAGAADELTDALLVNPYDVDGVADAMHRALTMDRGERRMRMAHLRAQVFEHDVRRWFDDYMEALTA